MKIYFACTTSEFSKYHDTYFKLRDFLVGENHVLTRDWLPEADKRLTYKRDVSIEDAKNMYKKCIRGIRDADLVIIEDTISSFSTGHQITISLNNRKPTLVLWQYDKKRQFKHSFIHGIESDLLMIKEYDKNNFQEIIRAFIQQYSTPFERNSFHLVLGGDERKYLDWLQYNRGKSRTHSIRFALREKMLQDKGYNEYLSKATKTD